MFNLSEFSFSNKAYAQVDYSTGYRYLNSDATFKFIQNKKVSLSQHLIINAQGYCALEDFQEAKIVDKERIMVLGDSYSACEVTDTTWSDFFNLKSRNKQLYNFSLDGSGIINWHFQFFKEIVPNYEFDGVLFAFYGNKRLTSFSLNRPMIIKHSLDNENRMGFFSKNDFESLKPNSIVKNTLYTSSILNNEEEELFMGNFKVKSFKLKPFNLYFGEFLIDIYNYYKLVWKYSQRYLFGQNVELNNDVVIETNEDLNRYINPENLQLLNEILEYCTVNNKKVHFVLIPDKNYLVNQAQSTENHLYYKIIRYLAKTTAAGYSSGYTPFLQMGKTEVDECFMREDNHWNSLGNKIFADYMISSFD